MQEQKQLKITRWMHTALAISKLESPVQCAKYLGISITTVYRHIDALEKALEFKIFDRNNSGWKLREEASVLLNTSKQIERLLIDAENEIRHTAGTESGNLRIAVSDDFARYVTGHLKAFCQRYPKIKPELVVSSEFSDLRNGQADVAIRPDMDPGDNLAGQRVAEMKHAFYASQNYMKLNGILKSKSDLDNHNICGYGTALQNYAVARWQKKYIDPEAFVASFSTTTAIAQAIVEDLGIGLLPCFVGDSLPEVSSIMKLDDDLSIDIWLVSTVVVRKRPKVTAFFDFFSKVMKADKSLFSG
jgi:DNA-binding transcriptional LysR family regulator